MMYRKRRQKIKDVIDAGYEGLYCIFCRHILQREVVVSILQKNFPKTWEEELEHLDRVHARLAQELATDPETYRMHMMFKQRRANIPPMPPCASHSLSQQAE